MKTNEMMDAIREKNGLLKQQSRRIELLEEKMSELRKRFFKLKYSSIFMENLYEGISSEDMPECNPV